MAVSDRLSTVYATDESIAIRASGDFAVLCPDWQKLAAGSDGAFAPAAPWRLGSATVDFEAAGVAAGHVVLLRKPATLFKGGGELLAVEMAQGHTLELRRLGTAPGRGHPPAPAAGVTGVEFLVATLDPQIEEASFELNRRLAIDPQWGGRTPADLRDLRDLRQACVLSVLAQRYAAETRGDQGDFAVKLSQIRQELAAVLNRLQLRWGSGGQLHPSTTWFSTRIVR